MSLFQQRANTAPVSAATSPIHSRAPSRAASPIEGHSANSGKHGHGSHQARDAKNRSHPYTHYSNTTPSSPHFTSQKHRMSPPKMIKTLSGHANAHSHHSHGHNHRERESVSHGHSAHSSHAHNSAAHHKSVEDILNSSGIPPPPPHSDRTLPPPNSSSSFSAGVPSMSYSLSSQPASTHASPNTSRASSPVHQTSHSHAHSHLAHSVRAAFGMTPMGAGGNKTPTGSAQSPPNRLPPMGGIGVGMGSQGNMGMNGMGSMMGDQKVVLPSFSRGSSPVHLM